SDLLDILSREGTPGIPVTLLPLKEVRGGAEELRRGLQGRRGIRVADAETDADLEALARAGLAQGSLLLAGSAGLAGAVSAALGLTSRPVACPAPGAWLIVAGSRHPSTRAQIAVLEAAGVAGARVSPTGETTLDSVIAALRSGKPAFVASPDGPGGADEKTAATLAALSVSAMIASPSILAIPGRSPLIGITMGDPAGVGPEITAKALATPSVTTSCRPVVIGDRSVMEATLSLLRSPLRLHVVAKPGEARFEPGTLECLDLGNVAAASLPRGQVSAEAGRAAYAYIEAAVRLCQAGEIDGMVTAPVNKEGLAAAGVQHSGHTEILARLSDTRDFAMLLMGRELKVIHVTTHVALRRVPGLCPRERV